MLFPLAMEALQECSEWLEAARESGIVFHGLGDRVKAAIAELSSPDIKRIGAVDAAVLQSVLEMRQSSNVVPKSLESVTHPEDWMSHIQWEIDRFTDGPSPRQAGCVEDWNFDSECFARIGALAIAAMESRAWIQQQVEREKAAQAILAEGAVI